MTVDFRFMTTAQKSIFLSQTFAKIAIPFNILIMLSVVFCNKWKRQLYPAKVLIFIVSFFEFMSCVAICLTPKRDDGTINQQICTAQASLVMVFTIATWLQYSQISLETHYLIRKFTSSMKISKSMNTKEVMLRHLPFHFMVIGFYIGCTIWMIYTKRYSFLGTWCWCNEINIRVYIAYCPLWASILLVMIINIDIIRIMKKSLASQGGAIPTIAAIAPEEGLLPAGIYNLDDIDTNPSNETFPRKSVVSNKSPSNNNNNTLLTNIATSDHGKNNDITLKRASTIRSSVIGSIAGGIPGKSKEKSRRMPAKAQSEFYRLIAIAFFFLLVHIPGSYIRTLQLASETTSLKTMTYMQLFFATSLPIPGIINCIIWILSNKTVLMDWSDNIYNTINYFPILRNCMDAINPRRNNPVNPSNGGGHRGSATSSFNNNNSIVMLFNRNNSLSASKRNLSACKHTGNPVYCCLLNSSIFFSTCYTNCIATTSICCSKFYYSSSTSNGVGNPNTTTTTTPGRRQLSVVHVHNHQQANNNNLIVMHPIYEDERKH